MRAAWLHDTRTALEQYGIGWAVWDYQGSFAVIDKVNRSATPDPAIAAALGLPSKRVQAPSSHRPETIR
jgi:hypothetical protein